MMGLSVSPDGEHCADAAHNEHTVSEQTGMNACFCNGPIKPRDLNVIGLLFLAEHYAPSYKGTFVGELAALNCVHQGDGNGTVPEASFTELMTHFEFERGFRWSSLRVQPCAFDRVCVCAFALR